LNLPVGDVCSSQSLANFSRLLREVVSTGSGAKRRFVFVVVSMGLGANLRLDVDFVVVVSIGCGANLRGFGLSESSALDLSLEDVTVVSIGSTLNRLGGAAGAILQYVPIADECSFLQSLKSR
jgi:hypothetical protein